MYEPWFAGQTANFYRAQSSEYLHPRCLKAKNPVEAACAPCSTEEAEDETLGVATVVAAVDFSPTSAIAARVSASVARHTHAQVVFCHAILPRILPFGPAAPACVSEAFRSEATKKMRPFIDLAQEAGVAATCAIEEGTPTGVILKVARRYAAALIILTSRDHSAWARLLFGPTITDQVIRQAACHVIVVRTAPE
jgi:nucleotide-binding universal stress UspA family protein